MYIDLGNQTPVGQGDERADHPYTGLHSSKLPSMVAVESWSRKFHYCVYYSLALFSLIT